MAIVYVYEQRFHKNRIFMVLVMLFVIERIIIVSGVFPLLFSEK